MVYASTFLSHSSTDKALVHAVARELGQRGTLPWLDVLELHAGNSLRDALTEAVRRQATLTVFLSFAAVESDWVERELKVACDLEKELGVKGRILPVFLDTPKIVVKAHEPSFIALGAMRISPAPISQAQVRFQAEIKTAKPVTPKLRRSLNTASWVQSHCCCAK